MYLAWLKDSMFEGLKSLLISYFYPSIPGSIEMVSNELRNVNFTTALERLGDYDFYDLLDDTINAIFDPWPQSD